VSEQIDHYWQGSPKVTRSATREVAAIGRHGTWARSLANLSYLLDAQSCVATTRSPGSGQAGLKNGCRAVSGR
jgi:hypothetical protein